MTTLSTPPLWILIIASIGICSCIYRIVIGLSGKKANKIKPKSLLELRPSKEKMEEAARHLGEEHTENPNWEKEFEERVAKKIKEFEEDNW